MARLAGIFRRSRRDASLDDEVRAHLEMLEEEYQRSGMTREEAGYAARRAFGSGADERALSRPARVAVD